MKNKLIKIALVGDTNVGKSTLINTLIGEKISIINKKINTTQNLILGILNIEETQIIFYDAPGSNFLKTKHIIQSSLKRIIWQAIDEVDYIFYIIDSIKYDYQKIYSELNKIKESKKKVVIVFNKIDLINNEILLPYIKELSKMIFIDSFFMISAKFNKGLNPILQFLSSNSKLNSWIFDKDQISNKDDIFITNECTRNAILKFLHKEIPYNLSIKNLKFQILKNKDIKIKQSIEIKNIRHKPIILGKKGITIKKIREASQNEIKDIMKSEVHLYLQVNKIND